ncbi:MAG: hypothetical protein ACD_46C00080G0012 [uncultured bacterium]|nr:MAG: hypothetical protein ACD_46C00080G0012 [uncultured bacterium]
MKRISLNKQFITAHGFTLIELIFIVMIFGIIAINVVPLWTSTAIGLDVEARRILQDIRYVQALSVTTGERYRWVMLSSSSYAITNEAGSAIVLPSGGTTLTLTNGVTIGSLSNLPNNLIAFNSQGIPYIDSSIPGTALSATAGIPVTLGGQTRTISIAPQTGYGVLS